MKRRLLAPGKAEARGFTLIELLTVIAIIGILASIQFPVFARAREEARSTACLSNLMQITLALHMYAQDNKGTFPPDGRGAKESVFPYVRNGQVFQCPSTNVPSGTLSTQPWGSYQYYPGQTDDGDPRRPLLSDREFVHNERANVVLVAGEGASLLKSEWTARGWKLPKKPTPPDYGSGPTRPGSPCPAP